ncbi:HNH endonuclease [Rhizobium laguerreae]|uniref:HNH endonuclease n=1 Tax=Rhizobium laguerreae TaxID=1076926 RepID=UPI001C92A5B8|nr:HNH endonuclease signature motif containing protein [Rhizobium laguerreae]MBY3513049.1 HNH endonuclease [Rhizobium laguerreae]
MKLLHGSDEILDAEFAILPGNGKFVIEWESRGGSDHGPRNSRNKDYAPAFESLLERMAKNGMVINQVFISSEKAIAAKPDQEDRKIFPKGYTYPVDLSAVDFGSFRKAVGRELAAFGQEPDVTGGNMTKRMTLDILWPANLNPSHAAIEDALLAAYGTDEGEAQRRLKYQPLGEYLRGRLPNDEVLLSLRELEKLVGPLPTTAKSHQFWANARAHHTSRRAQWLDQGFRAFYDPDEETVRFVRQVDREAPTDDPDELERRAKRIMERMRKSGKAPPSPTGNTNPDRSTKVQSTFERDPKVVAWILLNSSGKCERCGDPAPFQKDDETPFLEVHHVRPLAEGGPDTIDNAVACCPNCHRRLHRGRDRTELKQEMIARIERLIDYPVKIR